ncbi:MAG: hypothetical protein M3N47_10945 [Chloroflexota bacterium]|nr:hypothetical protein [Chloroflexota bacterium]
MDVRTRDTGGTALLRRLRVRSALGCAALALLALGLSACLSIKSQNTLQRVPGVISLSVVVCASDYDRSTYTTCAESNVAETDEVRTDSDDQAPTLGQLLLGFRVPDGSDGPSSFFNDAQDLGFSRSESYTQQLSSRFAPAPGTHWVAYVSTPTTFHPSGGTRHMAAAPEFTLPAQPGGEPLAGAFPWRVVVGFRQLNTIGQAADPVSCDDRSTVCVDSPRHARVSANLQAPVSDFGVLPGNTVTVGHGETAKVSLPVRYVDARGMGARQFSIAATTNLPASAATPSTASVLAESNSTATVDVSVPVPAGTPLGSYTVTLTATTGDPAVTRSNSATINVVDRIAPRIQIGTPAEGATFLQHQRVAAAYSCVDEPNGTHVKSCSGPVAPGAPIDTSSTGSKTFTVNASDNAGNTSTLTRTYTVVAAPPRTVVGAPPRIVVTLGLRYKVTRRGTRFTKFVVSGVPKGSTVSTRCRPAKRKGCPTRVLTKRNTRGAVSLKSFLRKRLRPSAVIEVRATKPGMVGAVKQLRIRARRGPSVKTLCLPVGAKRSAKPVKCPS